MSAKKMSTWALAGVCAYPFSPKHVIQAAFFQAAHIGPNFGRLNDQFTAPEEEKIPAM